MLTIDEREYLFRIADRRPPLVEGPRTGLPPTFRHLLDGLSAFPAYVVDAKYDILAWNRPMTHFIGDPDTVPAGSRNVIRWIFGQSGPENVWSDTQMLRFARITVADLRAAHARYPGDPGITSLVTELLGTSPAFAEMWAAHDVEVRGVITKRVDHPAFGTLEFACEILHVQAHRPAPDSVLRRAGHPGPRGIRPDGRAGPAVCLICSVDGCGCRCCCG